MKVFSVLILTMFVTAVSPRQVNSNFSRENFEQQGSNITTHVKGATPDETTTLMGQLAEMFKRIWKSMSQKVEQQIKKDTKEVLADVIHPIKSDLSALRNAAIVNQLTMSQMSLSMKDMKDSMKDMKESMKDMNKSIRDMKESMKDMKEGIIGVKDAVMQSSQDIKEAIAAGLRNYNDANNSQ